MRFRLIALLTVLGLCLSLAGHAAAPQVAFPPMALGADALGLVINDQDPYSREIGAHYAEARGIPAAHVVHLSFPPAHDLPPEVFERLKREVDARLPASVQALALAWTHPWKVGCMSVTSAFAFGFDKAYCSASQCAATRPNPLFNTATLAPYTDAGVRPAMLLAGSSATAARRMIDRGLAVEGRHPRGRAYLVITPDAARSTRAPGFPAIAQALQARVPVDIIEGNGIGERDDALFYFTGLPRVPELAHLRLVDGALADHLTSFGGTLEDGPQMSILAWLDAGASASYGTVVEPCSHPQKFPQPGIVMANYLGGATALEAYWRSVAWPGEGVFVGDPLARPFAPMAEAAGEQGVRFRVNSPGPARLALIGSDSPMGPFRAVGTVLPLKAGYNDVVLEHLGLAYYRATLLPK